MKYIITNNNYSYSLFQRKTRTRKKRIISCYNARHLKLFSLNFGSWATVVAMKMIRRFRRIGVSTPNAPLSKILLPAPLNAPVEKRHSTYCSPDHKVAQLYNIPYLKNRLKGIFFWLVLYKWTLNYYIMSEKHRNLPLWMVKSDVKCSKDKEAEKKKSHVNTKRIAKKPR